MSAPLSIIYFGSARFAVPPLRFLLAHPDRFAVRAVVTQPAQPVGRKGELTPTPVAEAVWAHGGVDVLEAATLKDDALYGKLRGLAPDLFVVAAYGRIIPKRYLEIPRVAALNLHGSLLPKYRGASPIQTAILEGEAETGVSLMVVDEEVDHGAVVAVERCAIALDDTYETLEDKLSALGVKLLDEKMEPFARGEVQIHPQDHEAATFTKIISKEDGEVHFAEEDAARIERKLRAYTPWPGAWFTWTREDGSALRLKLLKIEAVDVPSGLAPGTHFLLENGLPAVAAKSGAVALLHLQPEGKKPMDGKTFLNGYRDFSESTP